MEQTTAIITWTDDELMTINNMSIDTIINIMDLEDKNQNDRLYNEYSIEVQL